MLALLLAESAQAAAVSQSGVGRPERQGCRLGLLVFFFSKGRGREGTSLQVQAHLSHCRFAPAIHVRPPSLAWPNGQPTLRVHPGCTSRLRPAAHGTREGT